MEIGRNNFEVTLNFFRFTKKTFYFVTNLFKQKNFILQRYFHSFILSVVHTEPIVLAMLDSLLVRCTKC